VRVVVTGGGGFIGRALIDRLATRGVDVHALVRDPSKVGYLQQPRVTLEQSDLTDRQALTTAMTSADGVIHAAGSYRIGIPAAERPRMLDANLGTTERVLDAAVAAGARRIVYVSTNNIVGDTGGRIVDETYRRDPRTPAGRFTSWYDETKYRAHLAAEQRAAAGAPIVIVQPGGTYGPHDHSAVGAALQAAYRGKLRYMALVSGGLALAHVDDVATGVVAALIRGRPGEAYALGGECLRLGDALSIAARAGGHKPPPLVLPTRLLRLMAAFQRRGLPLSGGPSDLGEVIASGSGTYWVSHAKAARELNFDPRPLEQGVLDTWGRAASRSRPG
jgi:dihydroflavonol-4-reductase